MERKTQKTAAVVEVCPVVGDKNQNHEIAGEDTGPDFYRAATLVYAEGRLWRTGEVRPSHTPLSPSLWRRLESPTGNQQ